MLPGAVDLVHVHMASPHLPFSAGERERWGIRERPDEDKVYHKLEEFRCVA